MSLFSSSQSKPTPLHCWLYVLSSLVTVFPLSPQPHRLGVVSSNMLPGFSANLFMKTGAVETSARLWDKISFYFTLCQALG
jgi:hypothetical protein